MNTVSSEAWEEIGYREKPKDSVGPANIYKNLRKPPNHQHVTIEAQKSRRELSMEFIEQLKPMSEFYEEVDGKVRLKILGRWLELWPSTGCWYSHSKNIYGTGIEKLVSQVLEKLSHAK